MSELVQLTKTDGVAVVTINNPPVNALSSAVASGIAAAVAQIEKDDTVPAVIFIGAGRTFIAGAVYLVGACATAQASSRARQNVR
jgi:3-hydroxyacyl-CoA dehydrogenase